MFEELSGVEGGHAACACGGDGLTVVFVCDIACGEDALDGSVRRVWGCDDIAVLIHMDLFLEEGSGGVMTDGDEESLEVEGVLSFGLCIFEEDGFEGVCSEYIEHACIPQDFDFGVVEDARGEQVFCPQGVASMDEDDFFCVFCEEEGFFCGGISPANDSDNLVTKEESVAGGTTGDSFSSESGFIFESEPTCF